MSDEMVREVKFALARIDEWVGENLQDDQARMWFGHVAPSLERLRQLAYK